MKATQLRYLSTAFAAVGLLSLGVAQTGTDALGPTGVSSYNQGQVQSGQNQLDFTNVPTVKVNQTDIIFADARPAQINGELLVPVRDVAEQMGGTVLWLDTAKQVVITLPTQPNITLDTNRYWQEVPVGDESFGANEIILVGDRAYMPLEKLASCFNGTSDWDKVASTAVITTDQTEANIDQPVTVPDWPENKPDETMPPSDLPESKTDDETYSATPPTDQSETPANTDETPKKENNFDDVPPNYDKIDY